MPEPFDTYRIAIWVALNELSAGMNNWRGEFVNLGAQIAAQNWPAAQASCNTLCNEFSSDVRAKLCDSGGFKGKLNTALVWLGDNVGGAADPYELTMDKILDTIWESDKLRWFHFINYIDSMRAGIWNVEIYDKHLEEWYRHFST